MAKAVMGNMSLIILIAFIIVSAITSMVILTYTGQISGFAVKASSESQKSLTNKIITVEISGTDGTLGEISNLTQIIKLSPGSDEIDLNRTILRMTTYDDAITFKYCEKNSTSECYQTSTSHEQGEVHINIEQGDTISSAFTNFALDLDNDGIFNTNPLDDNKAVNSDTAGNQNYPNIAVGNGNVYIIWESLGDIYASVSSNGGVTWSTNVQINDNSGCDTPAIIVSGNIYSVFECGGLLYSSFSADGQTWSDDSLIGIGRNPAIKADSNFVYLAYESSCGASECEFFRRSSDGETWSNAVQIDSTAVTPVSKPNIAISYPNVYVTFQGLNNGLMIYYAISSNIGANWTYTGILVGSEIGNQYEPDIDVAGGFIYIVWANRTGSNNVRIKRCSSNCLVPANWVGGIVAGSSNVYRPSVDNYHAVWRSGSNIFTSSSSDNGATWSTAVRVDDSGSSDYPAVAYSDKQYFVWDADDIYTKNLLGDYVVASPSALTFYSSGGDVDTVPVDLSAGPISENLSIGSKGSVSIHGTISQAGNIDDDVNFEVISTKIPLDDLDADGTTDYLGLGEDFIRLFLSQKGEFNVSLGIDISGPTSVNIDQTVFDDRGEAVASVKMQGAVTVPYTISEDTIFTLTPALLASYFSVEYLTSGDDFQNRILGRSDVVQLSYRAANPLTPGDEVKVDLIPSQGVQTFSFFVMPEVISKRNIRLYPD